MSAKAPRAFLDTNVLVYLFDRDEPAKEQRARDILERAEPGELALSTQVLSEFYVTTTRKLKPPLNPKFTTQVIDWLGFLRVVPIDIALVKSALQISQLAQLSYWDGLIVAAAAQAGCGLLLTEDLNDGQEINSVRVENPFRDVD